MHGSSALDILMLVFADHRNGRDDERVLSSASASDAEADREETTSSKVAAGDAGAFDAVVTAHFAALVGFAESIVHSADVAEDIVQDALVSVWRRHERRPVQLSIEAYLFTAVRHRALDVLKRRRNHVHLMSALHAEARDRAAREAANEVAEGRLQDRMRVVQAALAALPERQRSALLLRYNRQLKVAEVAEIMGASVKATEQLLLRGVRALRAEVAGKDL